MTAPVSLRRAASLFGAICLCASFASASAAPDGAMTVAQNPPVQIPPNAAPPAPGEEDKEHKKERGEKGPQKGPQGITPAPNASPGYGQPPGPGPGGPPAYQKKQPMEKQPVAPKIIPPTTPQVVPQQPMVPQLQQQPPERERKRRPREEIITPPAVTPPVVPNLQPKVITPPAEKILPPPNSVAPQGTTPPSPGNTQPPPGATPFVPVPGMAPGKSLQPQGAPIEPAPKNSATPAPAPSNAQVPDTGFKRRSTTGPGARAPGAPPERAALPKAPAPQGAQPNFSLKFTPGFAPAGQAALRLQDLQKSRTQHTEEGGRRTVIEEPDNRVIVRQDNRVFVRHDETLRLATRARDVHSQRRSDGTTETVIIRPGGVLIYNVVDGGGRLIRRYRRDGRGREINIIDNRRFYEGAAAGLAIAAGVGIAAEVMGLHLGPPRIGIPREKYIVDYDRASDDDIDEALTAPRSSRSSAAIRWRRSATMWSCVTACAASISTLSTSTSARGT